MSPMQKASNRDTVFPGSGGDYLANIQRPNNSNLPESQVESSTRHSRVLVKSTTKSGLRDLYLPSKYKTQGVNWREDSPWLFYEGAYRIELGGSVAVVLRSDTGEQFTLSSASITEEQIKRLCELKHKNLVQTYEVFSYEGVYYTVSNHEAISLNHFIACDKSLNEAQLASIFAQSLEGIAYLATHGLRHSEIICSNILVSLEGVVKIVNIGANETGDGVDQRCKVAEAQALPMKRQAGAGQLIVQSKPIFMDIFGDNSDDQDYALATHRQQVAVQRVLSQRDGDNYGILGKDVHPYFNPDDKAPDAYRRVVRAAKALGVSSANIKGMKKYNEDEDEYRTLHEGVWID
ncbi:hypothetical protein AYO20_07378 [Fonsecaea nubica]|uniref:Protein kinase domain-containing protein n=1 Tax=Fonsecaea nubica TaxID=856822 RepID=A0A178CV67_9EURO|nr:hypothetical protein AYO20_07378 [Fonsecaea nubica]OAL33367.1 hypothetical protein AYO20_07378 [Fonsecaea nubica]